MLDLLSANDNRFKQELSKKEYRQSGVDKRSGMYINLLLARLHFRKTIKRFMYTAPPFYYFKDFSAEATEYILDCLTQTKVYTTALEEYRISHMENVISELKSKKCFPQIPVRLVTHSSELEIKEIEEFAGLQNSEAQKVESVWQSVMQEYLLLSHDSKLYKAIHSNHYIHLTDIDLVREIINEDLRKKDL